MFDLVRSALAALFALTLLTGVGYPLVVTVLAHAAFDDAAQGSLLRDGDKVIGSALIGQLFTRPEYFHGRPSAAGENGYDAGASSGSNLGATSKALTARVAELAKAAGGASVPADLVTASGSGLDPHISPSAARLQADRVAQARGLASERVLELIGRATEGRQFGVLGEPRVNVLRLNLSLDALR